MEIGFTTAAYVVAAVLFIQSLGDGARKILAQRQGRAAHRLADEMPALPQRHQLAIMLGATLGFLGLGAQPPSTEWGLMIAEARQFMFRNPWCVAAPGVAIAVAAMGFNLFGDALRDVLDPRSAR